MEADERTADLLAACREAGPDGPDPAWRARWRAAIAPLSPEEVRAWCRLQWVSAEGGAGDDPALHAAFWGVAAVAAHGTSALLGEHALRAHRAGKHRLAAAAIQALADVALASASDAAGHGREAIGELGRLRARLRHRGLARRIGQALGAAAVARGLDPDGLQDLVIEDGGLGADGTRTWRAGEHDVYLFLTEDGESELAIFERASGRALGAQAQALAPEHFGAFQEARAVQRALADALSTQKARLEQALEAQRAWSGPAWQQVFGAHPVMRHLAGRLVWTITAADGTTRHAMPEAAQWVDVRGEAVALASSDVLRLMHPATTPGAVVRAWQARLVGRRLVQPFKQAFREVVRPPDGGTTAGEPAQRVAGVVVRLRPLAAMLRARGWVGMSGAGPGGYVGRRELADHSLAALLTFRPVGKHRDPQRRLVALGRVGFVEPGDGAVARARPAELVPPVAYSEALRDVMLATAAAAVRPEPGSEAARARAGALAAVAASRAELVAALLPQLGLQEVVDLVGDAVHVRCSGHVFRLDLGTGEVTLAPGDRQVDLDGLERADLPLYVPHEGADAPASAVLATLVWLAKFGRACALRDAR